MADGEGEVVGAALLRWADGRFPLPGDPGHRWYTARGGVVAALAGAAVTLRAGDPDAKATGWVGDADPDQLRILAAASARPPVLVVVGAAGTGKTRTAAMIIRREIDTGGRVLVVTRQRYGVRRLWAELADVGVGARVPRAGSGAGGRRGASEGAGADDGAVLDRHRRAMVEPFGAWGLTLRGIQDHLVGRAPWTGPVLDPRRAAELDPREARRLARDLERFAHAGGLRDGVWHGVRIDTPEQARTTVGELAELRARFREIRAAAARARLHPDRPEPRDPAEWAACLALVKRVREFSVVIDPGILAGPYSIRQLLAATRWYGRPAVHRHLREHTRFPIDRGGMRLALAEARALRRLFREQPGGLPEAAFLRAMVPAWVDSEHQWQALAAYTETLFPTLGLAADTSLPDIAARLDRFARSISAEGVSPEVLADRCRSYARLATAGLAPLVASLTARTVPADEGADEYERFLYTSLAHAATTGDPGVVVGLQAHAHRYRIQAAATASAGGPGAVALSGGLMSSQAMPASEPVHVMSPRAARQLPDNAHFDLVVVDDAGTVSERDAIPALLRADRVVVIGDPLGPGLGDPDGPVEPGDPGSEGDLRSVLASVSRFVEPIRIGYPHRALDERLAMPSGGATGAELPGVHGEAAVRHIVSVEDDVAAVVETVRECRARHPDESVAVVTLGGSQARRIQAALPAGHSGPDLVVGRAAALHGGEWDTVLLSVGAKRDREGRLIHRFGAATMPGGDALVASAVSRARRRLIVVSAFEASELDPTRLRARGARMLRTVLRHAGSDNCGCGCGRGRSEGEAAVARAPARVDAVAGVRAGGNRRDVDGPDVFHADVLDRLREAGLDPMYEFGGPAGVVIALPDRPADLVLQLRLP
ncbi:hypothetical protein [Embleya sp. NPDC020630]|uniref:hypothetical protein n=1 Tax=Embleya sp. NPDC020630 TaxID=3363979 RepID=UPI0037B8034B